jgi:hypothetical protein
MNVGEIAIAFVAGALGAWLFRTIRGAWRRSRSREED